METSGDPMSTVLNLIIAALLLVNLYFLVGNERQLRRLARDQDELEQSIERLKERL
jgi:uncharacterized membrane protein